MLYWGDGLRTLNHQPYDGFQRDLLLLMWTVRFGRRFPLYQRSHPIRNHHLAGLLLFDGLWFYQRPPLSVVHLYKTGRMKLFTYSWNHLCKVKVNGLTSVNSFVIFDDFKGGFKTITIPMDGVRIYQLRPSPFFRLGLLKNLLEETKLLNTNLWAPSTCTENRRLKERTIADECKKYLQIRTDAYEMNVILPKLCRRAYTPSLLDGSSICHPLGRSNDSSSLYLSRVFQKWPSTTGSYWQNYTFPLTCQSRLDGSNEGIHALSAS